MRIDRGVALAMALVLAGCAPRVDNPSNPPKLGRWAKDWRLSNISINDLSMTRSELPFELPKDTHEDIGCIEPGMRDLADLNDALEGRTKGQCQATSLSVDGPALSGGGKCVFTGKGKDTSGRFTLTGTQGADKIKAVQTTDLFIHNDTGRTDQARMIYVLEWKRLGDCG